MARARQIPREAVPRVVSRGTPQLATDLSQLLRARSFAVEGTGPAVQRLLTNLQTSGATLDPNAAAWIGAGTPPTDRLTISLGEAAGSLGPHSYGFLNNLDGVCALSTSVATAPAERPRRGRVGVIVPRRDALPEILPLLATRGLGISWVISVGDGEPADVLRFLSLDPATSGILLALGQGGEARSLLDVLADKPTALYLPPHQQHVDRALVGAVARRSLALVTDDLEEWLAHGALLDVGARPRVAAPVAPGATKARSRKQPEPASGRTRIAGFVIGAGGSFVKNEVERHGLESRMTVQSFDTDDIESLRSELRQAALEAHTVLLCGPPELVSEVHATVPTLHADPAQPERLRAVLRALATPIPALFVDGTDSSASAGHAVVRDGILEREADEPRLAAVLSDLPPPLYLSAKAVSDEQLSDHDTKRLLHAYGAKVLRQAPVATANAALKLLPKLELPVRVVPVLPWQPDVAALAAAETRDGVLCQSQAEVKRYVTLLLGRHQLVVLREDRAPAPRLRLRVSAEHGIGPVLRLGVFFDGAPAASAKSRDLAATRSDRAAQDEAAALVPLHKSDGETLSAALASAGPLPEPTRAKLVELLAAVSSCAAAHHASLELLITADAEPAIEVATAVLRRPTASA